MSKAPKLTHRKTGGGTSVEEWGVRGDGTFNETLKIQNALDNFQHVYFPPGTYLVDGSLTASLDKQVIEGAGKGSVIKMMAGKTYDLTQQHAALTMNAGEQTLQDLQLIGPDTGDDSTFSGSGSDWYNLSGLRVDGDLTNVKGVQIDRCESVGIDVLRGYCKVSLCTVERTGLEGLRLPGGFGFVSATHFNYCQKTEYNSITTYPSGTTSAVHLIGNDCIVSDCHLQYNARDITSENSLQVICNNTCRSGVHVLGTNTVVTGNTLVGDGRNAITVANDGNAHISSLTGNHVEAMDQGGADDIIARDSYSIKPVKHATGNNNPDIDRIYQRKAYAEINTGTASTDSNGLVPLSTDTASSVIDVDTSNHTLAVLRPAWVQISMPIAEASTSFGEGRLVLDDDSGGFAGSSVLQTYDDSASSKVFVACPTFVSGLQPNRLYRIYMYTNENADNPADLTFQNPSSITITDVE